MGAEEAARISGSAFWAARYTSAAAEQASEEAEYIGAVEIAAAEAVARIPAVAAGEEARTAAWAAAVADPLTQMNYQMTDQTLRIPAALAGRSVLAREAVEEEPEAAAPEVASERLPEQRAPAMIQFPIVKHQTPIPASPHQPSL